MPEVTVTGRPEIFEQAIDRFRRRGLQDRHEGRSAFQFDLIRSADAHYGRWPVRMHWQSGHSAAEFTFHFADADEAVMFRLRHG